MPETYRLFWAVNLPEDMKAVLARLQDRLRHPALDAKWVEQENLHLTLKFLGETEAATVTALVDAVRERVSGSGSVLLELCRCGTFGRPPRVLWVGVQGDVPRLRAVHERVEEACRPLGFEPETRGFSPHLTLARLRAAGRGLPREVAAAAAAVGSLGTLSVTSIELMRSRLSPRGPVYSVLASVNL
ncbi:MAG: RNA 2',3'-cyclic phosphodiesterase [Bacillota bacterium]|nr:RNA 2',3'-cyclic phosphodiesterase [Bacillota bacterium]